jgi:hypothetical protein
MHTIIDKDTGEILGHFSCTDEVFDEFIAAFPPEHEGIRDGGIYDGALWYHDLANTFLPRPKISVEPNKTLLMADGTDSIIISGLPIPSTIKVDTQEYIIEDGEFEFTVDMPGVFHITCTAFPHMPKTWVVEAV